jgi:hypothetical protein
MSSAHSVKVTVETVVAPMLIELLSISDPQYACALELMLFIVSRGVVEESVSVEVVVTSHRVTFVG